MPTQVIFGVEFTRSKMQSILDNQDVSYVVVSGTYTHQGDGDWTMIANAGGYGSDKAIRGPLQSADCIQPCPHT